MLSDQSPGCDACLLTSMPAILNGSLEDGGRMLVAAMRCECKALSKRMTSSASLRQGSGGSGVSEKDVEVMVVREGEDVHPLAGKQSYVYVARTACGWFYVGETDDLQGRLSSHRTSRKLGAKGTDFVCLAVPSGGKSMARRVEAALLRCVCLVLPFESLGGNRIAVVHVG